ncbi:MAG: hypothetical protein JO256_12925 [Alphaproteobacteria bacterium]|nr:hypothetical protein [Alphaproteobacteria bacterium]
MTQYFFDLYANGIRIMDAIGANCENLSAARLEARMHARDRELEPLAQSDFAGSRLEIRDSSGDIVASMTVRETLLHPGEGERESKP